MILSTDLTAIKKHPVLTSCTEVLEIMQPLLKKHGMTIFNFHKEYADGTMIRLSTHQVWTEHYFERGYPLISTVPESYLSKPLNYFIWLIEDCPVLLRDASINFNISNGISIVQKIKNSIEFYCFATTVNNQAIINNFYINNLYLLKKYCSYFKEKASHLINQSEKNKIGINSNNNHFKKMSFQPLNLSQRQLDCAQLLLYGKTCKEIAKVLNLSPRTIETHFDYIKTKLGCINKTELIIKLTDLL